MHRCYGRIASGAHDPKRTSSAWYFCDAKWRVTPFGRPEFPALLARLHSPVGMVLSLGESSTKYFRGSSASEFYSTRLTPRRFA
jgi:hypothetical protein